MALPSFEDLSPSSNSQVGYSCTNEEAMLHRWLLRRAAGQRQFKTVGAVAWGGDVLWGVLLPRSQRIVAVDHSYRSLAAAYLKALMLDSIGVEEMRTLLLERSHADFCAAAEAAAAKLPEVLRSCTKFDAGSFGISSWNELRAEWAGLTDLALRRAKGRLGSVRLLHGDLSHLTTFGPFDCLYTSNALYEHSSLAAAGNRSPTLDTVAPLVQEGGWLLMTRGINQVDVSKSWEHVRSITGTRTSWSYRLYRRKADVVERSQAAS